MVDANDLLLLRVGIILTVGGGALGLMGADDVALACRLTLGSGMLSLGHGSLGGCGLFMGSFFRALAMVLIHSGETSCPSSLFILHPLGAECLRPKAV